MSANSDEPLPEPTGAPLRFCFRKLSAAISSGRRKDWLPDMDLNHDKQIQRLLCYRYTIGQAGSAAKLSQVNCRVKHCHA